MRFVMRPLTHLMEVTALVILFVVAECCLPHLSRHHHCQ
jgi:hypothetical protein